jgi:hypothetical protein
MSAEPTLEFVLRDRVDGVEITPDTIGLSRFNEFNRQAQEFLAGSKGLALDEVHVRIEPGSYKLVTCLPLAVIASIEPDLQSLQRQDSLGEIDPKRAEIVARWQARTKSDQELSFTIRPVGFAAEPVEVSRSTDFRVGEFEPWVKIEKYLFGTVLDMGGAQKANIHLRLEDSGNIVRIGSHQGYLKKQPINRLYHKALVRVEAEQHHLTGQLRHLRLIGFEDYQPGYDEEALDAFIAAGAPAWADVPDAAQWVRELRGGQE